MYRYKVPEKKTRGNKVVDQISSVTVRKLQAFGIVVCHFECRTIEYSDWPKQLSLSLNLQ